MITFTICATLLVAAVLSRLLLPLLHTKNVDTKAGALRQSQQTIFRDQLAELTREHMQGLLTEADFAQAKRELQRRLLEEIDTKAGDTADSPQPTSVTSTVTAYRKTAFALFLLVPLAAAAGYALLGNPDALDPARRQQPAPISMQQIESMVAGLAAKLKQHPEDTKGWVMLARSYKVLERFAEAADAYAHAEKLIEKDPMLLADYAEVLSRANKGNLQGKPSELLTRSLALDPDEPQALLLAGAAANEREEFSTAADYWTRLLRQLEPGSEAATSVEAAIAKARERASAAKNADKRDYRSAATLR